MKTSFPGPTGQTLGVLVFVLFVFLGGRVDSASGAAASKLELWRNSSKVWGSTVQADNSSYREDGIIPGRFVSTMTGGSHTLVIKYDFSDGGLNRFIDYLSTFDSSETGVDPAAGVANAGAPSQWLIPIDPAVGVDRQTRHYPQGTLTTYNVSSATAVGYSQVGGVRMLTINLVVPGTSKQKRNVVVAWGIHLADDKEWAPGSGAGAFPGASRKIYTSLDGATDENVSINPNAITMNEDADLAITKLSDPNATPVHSGDLLTYFINVENKGPEVATGVTVTDLLPPNVALVNVIQSQGTYVVGANSILTFSLGSLEVGSSAIAAIQVASQVDSSFVGTLLNVATVTGLEPDPDLSNNSSTVETVVTDGTSPVVNCPGNIMVNTDPMSATAIVTFAATASDNVGVTSLTYSKSPGSAFQIGTTTVTATATDAAGNSSQCSFTVTVLDAEAPVLVCPADIEVGTDPGVPSAVVSYSASATDNSGFAPMLSFSHDPGSTFPVGTTTVTVTATDFDGNSSQCSFDVTVLDDEAPAIVCPANIVVGTDDGLATAVVNFAASATDNVAVAEISYVPASGTAFPVGETTVVATATDAAGNETSCAFTVTVMDDEAPTITAPADVAVNTAFGSYKAIVSFPAPEVADNVSPDAQITIGCSIASGTQLEVGIYTVTCTATDAADNISAPVQFTITVADQFNVAWPLAHELILQPLVPGADDVLAAEAKQFIIETSQSRWFRFRVQPGSKLVVTLTELAANYDVVLFSDIAAAYNEILHPSQNALLQLGAEFASDAFAPAAFSPEAFSPAAFSPAAFSPAAFSPAAFSPAAFSPAAFSPEAFSPAAFSPAAFSPEAIAPAAFSPAAFSPAAFSPLAFSPAAFSPAAFSPAAFSPAAFSPAAFSSAQTRSVIGVSAFPGLLGEGLIVNTWDNSGEFYLRVRGRNGEFNKQQQFKLNVVLYSGQCGGVDPVLNEVNALSPTDGDFKTIILTDSSRLPGVDDGRLIALAARPEVAGVIVDLSQWARVVEANAQADANVECPIAKNLVAEAIKEIVDGYMALNPIEYVVIVGGDEVIPFYRHPDEALLANENNYVPPVLDATSSQASLKLGFVLGQDFYGARCEIARKTFALPLPSAAVGRLVEEPADIHAQLDAYLGTANGVVPTPDHALVTAYDFLSDVGEAVRLEFEAGLNLPVSDSLIAPAHEPPSLGWTAGDLKAQLLGPTQPDLVFLAGHFAASVALAADYTTRFTTEELMASSASFLNSIIFSSGCHSGYNVVNQHGIPGVTGEPDWTQAFARKGATLIAGTGYQYGDTDFIEYSEQIYLNFARNLRAGTGPVSVGKALVSAKNTFLAQTAHLRGIHEKSLLITTLFGLPMLSVDLPAGRGALPTDASIITTPLNNYDDGNPATVSAAEFLGLESTDVTLSPSLDRVDPALVDTEAPLGSAPVVTTYFSGKDGVVANPAEPILPLATYNVSVPDTVLRGVGFLGGTYADLANVIPHTGAPATEIRGVHAPFLSDVFFPVRIWNVNYLDALCEGSGATRLLLMPSQFVSEAPGASAGVIRTFSDVNFRLFYSANAEVYGAGTAGENVPAFAGAPTIVQVSDEIVGDQVNITVQVLGDPSAGMQDVWITYTVAGSGTWQSVFLTQNATDSSFWEGVLPLNGSAPGDVRYLVQAVNGTGLVTMDANLGEFFIPGETFLAPDPDAVATAIELLAPLPSTGIYNQPVGFSARLTTAQVAVPGAPLASQRVTFSLGTTQRQAFTDANGVATVQFPLLSLPGSYDLQVTFRGTRSLLASVDQAPFTVSKRDTVLLLEPANLPNADPEDTGLFATLREAPLGGAEGAPLQEKTVIFIVDGPSGRLEKAIITDYLGRALLELPSGSYNISAYFSGVIPFTNGHLTVKDDRYHPTSAAIGVVIDADPPVFDDPSLSVGVSTEATSPDGAVVTFITEATGSGGAEVTFEVTATDPGGVTIVITKTATGEVVNSGDLFPLGTTLVTATATDAVGNSSSLTFGITVQDTTPPVITIPANMVVEATGPAGATVSFTTSALDIVDLAVPTVNNPASGSTFPLGTTTVNVSAGDAAGNVANASLTVTVQDTTAPVITVPANITVEGSTLGGAIVTFATSALDMVSGNVATLNTPASGSLFPVGATTVTTTATDAAGLQAVKTFTVTVTDTTPPVITVPANITTGMTGPTGAIVTFSTSAIDIVSGNVATVNTPASGSLFPVGTTTVTTTATDAAGRQAVKTFTVTVKDLTLPVITSITANPSVINQSNHKMRNVTVTVVAIDNYSSVTSRIINVTSNEPVEGTGDGDTSPDWVITGNLTVDLRAERAQNGTGRTYTIFIECKDAAGNIATGNVTSVTVFVPKN